MTIIERNKLIENHIPLARKIAFQFKKKLPLCFDIDELVSVAYIGLIDAAIRFNETKSNSFGTYARFRILGEIRDYIRKIYNFNKSHFDIDALFLMSY